MEPSTSTPRWVKVFAVIVVVVVALILASLLTGGGGGHGPGRHAGDAGYALLAFARAA